MSLILTPVLSKFTLNAGTPQEVYACPANKSHAIVDVTFFKDIVGADTLIEIALTTKSSAAQLDSVDYFIDDIELVGNVNSAELNKLIVGPGERIYINVVSGPAIVARLSGVEESNSRVLNAGRLAAMSVPGTSFTTVFSNDLPSVSYSTVSVTVYNSSDVEGADVEAWISNSDTPSPVDKVMKISIPTEDTTIVENITLLPNEKLIFKSSVGGVEYFVNGLVVGGV